MDHELEKGLRHAVEAKAPEIRQRQRNSPFLTLVEAITRRQTIVAYICALFLMIEFGSFVTYTIMRHVYGEREARLREECGYSHGHLQALCGGLAERPMDNQCYRQERTAILLSVYLGWLGMDQWCAHHWALAVFKMLAPQLLLFWWMADFIM
ncbi:TM2 domain-containing protein [Aspergillus brunneoviolaceus CBS 621.78]|uniref:Uncharacterized protein n=1 Tax=Aspergillus brunneoviolaceus CBS 621.78 TaxID=1450534 RepID=A0ACD1GF50_9EURO|nr:hypothetical protein BO95DRAFT_461815 [Aspergillus brunneoviolaceus CBS 621.78]RAH47749.1 hypothetical protein BO95DRAFT_461815 [Aspergillus brunneoviolaceus CBS 621.78]